jgi:CTP synthase (UTP-ammonia lyase)
VAGLPEADYMADDLNTAYPLLVLSSCPVDNRPPGAPRLWGGLKIKVLPGTLAYQIYKNNDIEEAFNCNYELNPAYQQILEKAGLKISGVNQTGSARIVELPGRAFYMGTGFVPQMSSRPGQPHPMIVAWLKAALK